MKTKNLKKQVLLFSSLLMLLLFGAKAINAQVEITVGGLVGTAPNLVYEEHNGQRYEGSNLIFSLIGELQINQQGLARFQASLINVQGLDTEYAERVESGSAFTGTVGYLIGGKSAQKLQFAIMGGGGVSVLQLGNGVVDASPLAGITVGPRLKLTEQLAVLLEARYYTGFKTGAYGGAIDIFDVALGVGYRF